MFAPGGPTLRELIAQAWTSTERGYDLLAPKFERTPFRTPDALLDVASARVAALAPARVLDVCTGTGAFLRALPASCAAMRVGLDRSRGMLTEARAHGAPGTALIRGDATALPFREAFDVVTCFGAFGHLVGADEGRFVRAVHDALRPGGRFIFVTVDERLIPRSRVLALRAFNAAMHVRNALRDPPFVMTYLTFTLPDVVRLLEWAGFEVSVTIPGLPRPFAPYRLVEARRVAVGERGVIR